MSLTTKSRYSLAENSLKTCEDLVSELMRQDDAWPFLKPVTKKEVNISLMYINLIFVIRWQVAKHCVCSCLWQNLLTTSYRVSQNAT